MRKLLEMCVCGLGLVAGLFVVLGLILASGFMCVLVRVSESVASLRDGEPPAGL